MQLVDVLGLGDRLGVGADDPHVEAVVGAARDHAADAAHPDDAHGAPTSSV